ncbi:MAG: hypothetical protein HC807_02345, partial [Gammaproteobacteria bacterium]|nr:hypothetical protein [Gammaproteobacteria bacterium]
NSTATVSKSTTNLQTTNKRIFAAGDICSKFKFTHAADFQARIVIQNALFHGRAKASSLRIPWATYTSPEVAHVGLYEAEARQRGIEVDTFTQELSKVDRAILDGETDGFVRVHVRQGAAEIDLRRRGETVRPLTEVDLVDIDLEDLVLGQARLDPEREEHLVGLPDQRLVGREEEVSGHLHGDRTGALPLAPREEVGVGCSYDADIIDALMAVEPFVFGGEDGLLHDLGNRVDLHDRPALLAELADERAVGRVDPQRDLGLVGGEHLDGGEVRKGQEHHESGERRAHDREPREEREGKYQPAEPPHGKDLSGVQVGAIIGIPWGVASPDKREKFACPP